MKMAGHYQDIRGMIKSGDMIEFSSKSIVGAAIRFFTKKEVNHTALAVGLDQYMGYSEPHKFILEANSGGIELGFLSRVLKGYDGKAYWSPLKSCFDSKRDEIARWAMLRVGTPYDFGSLFKNLIGKVNADAKKLFCSEFYFLALVENKILPKGKAPRPGEFGRFEIHGDPVEILP